MPVTRHPPCSPGRAVFPHPVPRLHSLPRKAEPLSALALFALARREAGSCSSGPTCPGCVSFAGCGLPSRPSPCRGLSPPLSTTLDTTPQTPTTGFPCHRTPPPACHPGPQGCVGSSMVPCPGVPCRASGAVDHTPTFSTDRNVEGLPRSSTPLFLHATA